MAARARASGFDGVAYRHAAPNSVEIGEGLLEGSRRVGGRFNPRSEFGAVYLSLDRRTVAAELRRRASRAGVDVEDLLPRRLVTAEVRVGRVLDLTDAGERKAWGLDPAALESDDHSACIEVGRRAREEAYEAILYPSAADPSGLNLAVFLDRLPPESRVRVQKDERLEP